MSCWTSLSSSYLLSTVFSLDEWLRTLCREAHAQHSHRDAQPPCRCPWSPSLSSPFARLFIEFCRTPAPFPAECEFEEAKAFAKRPFPRKLLPLEKENRRLKDPFPEDWANWFIIERAVRTRR
jgi:hypothetical protein